MVAIAQADFVEQRALFDGKNLEAIDALAVEIGDKSCRLEHLTEARPQLLLHPRTVKHYRSAAIAATTIFGLLLLLARLVS